ncbi:PLC-like phosphodiesterase [Xylariaceae sp. AK1471]|nr:PLC-like phosphodiesterase [Xylariaceae sp. AK1471]
MHGTDMRFAIGICTLLTHSALVIANGGTLGQMALQKILQDGRDVFGDFKLESSSSDSSRHAYWMAHLPDSIPITQLNIPGTHDTATWNYTQATQDEMSYATRCDGTTPARARVYRCQRRSIAESLEAGIRFFDLRFALDPLDARLVFWHGPALLSARATVEDVLFGFYGWLDTHPSETVILSLKYEDSTKANATSDAKVQGSLFDVLMSGTAKRYIHQGRGAVGTLGEVRGKIILFRRFDLSSLPPEFEEAIPGLHMSPVDWPDNSRDFALVYNQTTGATAYIEDYYYPSDYTTVEDNIAAKFDAVSAHLEKAAAGDYDSLFVTFTSGTHVDVLPPVYPEVMALGSGAMDNTTAGGGVNYRLVKLLDELKGKRLGIVIMDFFEEPKGLVDSSFFQIRVQHHV